MGLMIPIIGVTLALSIPIVLVIVDYRKRRRMMELQHAERMASIERGMEPLPWPAAEVLGPAPRKRPQTTLLPGLIWLFVGVAMFFAFGSIIEEDINLGLFGLIPAGVGLAYLVYWLVEGRKVEARNGNGTHVQSNSEPPR